MAVFKCASSLLVDSQGSDRKAVRGNWTWVQPDLAEECVETRRL